MQKSTRKALDRSDHEAEVVRSMLRGIGLDAADDGSQPEAKKE